MATGGLCYLVRSCWRNSYSTRLNIAGGGPTRGQPGWTDKQEHQHCHAGAVRPCEGCLDTTTPAARRHAESLLPLPVCRLARWFTSTSCAACSHLHAAWATAAPWRRLSQHCGRWAVWRGAPGWLPLPPPTWPCAALSLGSRTTRHQIPVAYSWMVAACRVRCCSNTADMASPRCTSSGWPPATRCCAGGAPLGPSSRCEMPT